MRVSPTNNYPADWWKHCHEPSQDLPEWESLRASTVQLLWRLIVLLCGMLGDISAQNGTPTILGCYHPWEIITVVYLMYVWSDRQITIWSLDDSRSGVNKSSTAMSQAKTYQNENTVLALKASIAQILDQLVVLLCGIRRHGLKGHTVSHTYPTQHCGCCLPHKIITLICLLCSTSFQTQKLDRLLLLCSL